MIISVHNHAIRVPFENITFQNDQQARVLVAGIRQASEQRAGQKATLQTYTSVIDRFQKKQYITTTTIFVDLQQAYDNILIISENSPPTKNEKHGHIGHLNAWIKSFLSNRLIQTKCLLTHGSSGGGPTSRFIKELHTIPDLS